MLRKGTQEHSILPRESPDTADAETGDALVQTVQAELIKTLIYFIIVSL